MPKRFDQTTNAASVAATDNVPFITAGGVTSYVTGDELAASTSFSSRYKALASDRIWMPAQELFATSGSAVMGTLGNASSGTNRTPAMLFDAASFEFAVGVFVMPPGWSTFSTHLWWSNAGAGTGDVSWVHYNDQFSSGDTSDAAPTGTFVTPTAPLQYVLLRTSFSGTTSATAGQLVRVTIMRNGPSGTDTLANDAGLVAIELVRAS